MKQKKAITLVEITIAIVILIAAILPLVKMSSKDAVKAIETEKIQMADRILESIKSEITSMPFKRFYERAEQKDNQESNGPFVLEDGFYPVTLNEVLEIQRQYKNFEVIGSWSFVVPKGSTERAMVQAEVSCSFERTRGMPKVVRKKSFLVVKP